MHQKPSWKVSHVAWPVLIEQLLFMFMGTADTFMLSHVSSAAVAAVGASNQVIGLVLLVFSMVSGGTAVLVTQYLGANRIEECSKYSAASLTVNFAVGLVVSIVLGLAPQVVAVTMQLPSNVAVYSDAYMRIVGGGLFIQALLGAAGSILRANGFTRIAMFVSLGMNALHIFGNYLFIFGAFGVPRLGVTGVAISTTASRLLAFAAMMVLIYRYLPYRILVRDYIHMGLTPLKRVLAIGVPSAGEPIAYQTAQIVMVTFMASLGAVVLATRVYTVNIMSYIFVFGSAVGFGTQIVVGHLCGAGELETAYRQVWKSLRVSLAVTVVIALFMAATGPMWFHLFTRNQQIERMGTQLLLICILLEPGRTFNLVIIQSLRAAGDVKFPVLMGILFPICMGIPLSYLLGIHLHMGLSGVWWTICIDEWSRAIIMSVRWRSRVWQTKVLVAPRAIEGLPVEV